MSISNLLIDNKYQIYGRIFQMNEVANAVTTSITGAQVADGIATIATAGGAVSCQLPTAAALVAAFPGIIVGNVVKCLFAANGATNAATLTTNTGLTLLAAPSIPAQTSRIVYFRFTNVTLTTEAVSVY